MSERMQSETGQQTKLSPMFLFFRLFLSTASLFSLTPTQTRTPQIRGRATGGNAKLPGNLVALHALRKAA